jgi:hypothetical protein
MFAYWAMISFASLLKITEVAQMFWLLFLRIKICISSYKRGIWLHFGRFSQTSCHPGPNHSTPINHIVGEPLWLSSKVVKNVKINEIKRTLVRSPPRATSLKKSIAVFVQGFWGLNLYSMATVPI